MGNRETKTAGLLADQGTDTRPIQDMTHEEERVQFFAAQGEALSEWTRVENYLCFIFMVCKRVPHRRCAVAFFQIKNFRSKLEMVDSAVRLAGLDPAKTDKWKVLCKRIDKKSILRNHLAHYDVLEDRTPSAKPGKRFLLRARLLDPSSPSVFNNQGLRISQLRDIGRGFSELVDDMARFYGELCQFLGMPNRKDRERRLHDIARSPKW